jgi:hypothetical protein
MRNTWGSLLEYADPFHNPNLLFSGERFEVPVSPSRRKPWRDLGEQVLNLRRFLAIARNGPDQSSAVMTQPIIPIRHHALLHFLSSQ